MLENLEDASSDDDFVKDDQIWKAPRFVSQKLDLSQVQKKLCFMY